MNTLRRQIIGSWKNVERTGSIPSAIQRQLSAPSLLQTRSKHYLSASAKTFEERLQNHDGRLVLVDFYADWCGPCKMISPILEKVTSDTKFSNGKEVDLITIDTDEEGALAQKYKVTALPTVIAIRDGQVLNQFVGAQPAPAVQEWVKALST